ncbi:hypothetical protein HK105_204534 [Polyrhizophydium stewartii]|uniref:tRNA-guanine(15) transglycosylase-like domain-containing protein n=1 Tax=Polyrhizophydium stewartii TaxID=2732419 RepID=A0ABR4N8H1_9FUNG
MIFSVEAEVPGQRARSGRLVVNGQTLQTPCCMHYSRQGCVPHITDAAATLGQCDGMPLAINVALEHFVDLDKPRAERRKVQGRGHSQPATPGESEEPGAAGTGALVTTLHEYLGMPADSYVLLATPHDMDRLAKRERWVASTKTAVGLLTNGNIESRLQPKAFMELLRVLRPDAAVCLADPGEAFYRNGTPDAAAGQASESGADGSQGSRPPRVSKGRQQVAARAAPAENAVDDATGESMSTEASPERVAQRELRRRAERNLTFLKAVIGLCRAEGSVQPRIPLLAMLCGEHDLDERRFYGASVAECIGKSADALAGVAVSVPPLAVAKAHGGSAAAYIGASLESIPRSLPVLCAGIERIEDLVAAVAAGADVLDNKWAYDLTMQGLAIVASFEAPVSTEDHGLPAAGPEGAAAAGGQLLGGRRGSDGGGRPLKRVCGSAGRAAGGAGPAAGPGPEAVDAGADGASRRRSAVTRLHGHAVVADLRAGLAGPKGRAGAAGLGGAAGAAAAAASVWAEDMRAISPRCGCWTCARPHGRAYVHHLLAVDDMLALVLLHQHNAWQLARFVAAMRAAAAAGSFAAAAAAFGVE